MSRAARGFSRMARAYRALELLAFGRDLERARFAHLGELRDARRILLIGEGDGRCAERLAAVAPGARITCLDSSPGMVARAERRLAGTPAAARVQFRCADARTADLGPEPFDGVATLFFLDCLTPAEVDALVRRTSAALAPGARWLFADFVLPARGWRRARARAWLAFLYACFRWETGLGVAALPPSEALLSAHGWREKAARDWQHGMVRSAAYERRAALTAAPAASA